jgi:hypothetical protein
MCIFSPVDWTCEHYAHIWDQLQLPVAMFRKYLKTEKDRFRPVSTGLSSRHVLDLTHVQFYLIFGP